MSSEGELVGDNITIPMPSSPMQTESFPSSSPRYLLLASSNDQHGTRSGYTALASHIPRSLLIEEKRAEPKGIVERIGVGLLSRMACSRWYRLGSLRMEWRAWRTLRKGFNGVIHFLWADRDWGFLDLIANTGRTPLCATFHSCPDTLPEVLRRGDRLRKLDAIILMSEVQRPFFEALGVSPEKIHVIHHGVDCGFFRPAASPTCTNNFTVLSVGNYRRNFARLRKVCQLLKAAPQVRVKIIGPQARKSFFSDTPNVEFVSELSDDDLCRAYQDASCLLMTVDAATANNAVLEAMACGLPVVGEDVGGIAEYTGKKASILCQPGNAELLTAAVLRLSRLPEEVAKMRMKARQRALELEWTTVAKHTMQIYDHLLDRKSNEMP